VIALFLRLFALRPLLSAAILGFPVLVLIAIGLATIFAVKLLVFVVLPVGLAIWLVRRYMRRNRPVVQDPVGENG
jgi:hypothetical protein